VIGIYIRVMPTYLVEAILTPIADIYRLDDPLCQPLIEKITLSKFSLEICAPGKNQSSDIDFIIGYEMLYGHLRHFTDIIMSLLVSLARETLSRLSATTMFFRQINSKSIDDFACTVPATTSPTRSIWLEEKFDKS
jgi:hypothetical protein